MHAETLLPTLAAGIAAGPDPEVPMRFVSRAGWEYPADGPRVVGAREEGGRAVRPD
jgi:hypothetical protein